MKELIIIGAGGFGREVKCLIDDINRSLQSPAYSILGFVDDGVAAGTAVHEYEVLGTSDYIDALESKPALVLAIGNPTIKAGLAKRFHSYDFPTLVHPTVSLTGTNIQIGKGCIICAGNLLTCDIQIADFVILNLTCTVGHDTEIGSYCSIMPGVNISGEVILQEAAYIGTGATIINQTELGEGCVIGAGAVVSKSIPAHCTAVGIPAKPIKFHTHE